MFKPFQHAARVRSFKAFMADAHRVGIKQSDEALTIGPCRNRGTQGGFETISDQRVRRAPGDPEGAAAATPEMIEAGTRSEEGQPPNEPDLKRRKPPLKKRRTRRASPQAAKPGNSSPSSE